jgi:sulfonate transport system substrate-binding protein
MKTRTIPRIAGALACLAAFVPLMAAGVSGAGATTSSIHHGAREASIPPGTVLRVGEQLKNLSTVLSLGHENQNFPYQVQYDEFVGGPSMLQAFEGGSLDVGYIASTPLIFAQAAAQQVTAVAGWATAGTAYALVSAPGVRSIKSWADLKGKRVAYQQGTAVESALLEGLKTAGLTLRDITSVNLPTTQIAAALQGGSADAGIEVEPLLSAYLQANPSARVIAHPGAITEKAGFLVATSSALANKSVSAALADYISRLIMAYAYLKTHPRAVIQSVYEGQYGLTPQRAAAVSAAVGSTSFFALPGGIVGPQQNLANLYLAAGSIPARINVAKEFDARFNSLVSSVQGS